MPWLHLFVEGGESSHDLPFPGGPRAAVAAAAGIGPAAGGDAGGDADGLGGGGAGKSVAWGDLSPAARELVMAAREREAALHEATGGGWDDFRLPVG